MIVIQFGSYVNYKRVTIPVTIFSAIPRGDRVFPNYSRKKQRNEGKSAVGFLRRHLAAVPSALFYRDEEEGENVPIFS
jgi:hypothetical protein